MLKSNRCQSILLVLFCLAVCSPVVLAQRQGDRNGPPGSSFNVVVPAHPYDLILARPEKNSILLSVLAYQDMEGFIRLGTTSGVYSRQTPPRKFAKGTPVEMGLDNLQTNSIYYYQFCWRSPGAETFSNSPEYHFHTARPAGSTFKFTITADAHLDEHTSPEVYLRTLANISADAPDFHIDLGNLFMTDKHRSRDEAAAQYVAQRYYLGQIGCNTPIFLALGVHDGESSRYDDGTETSLTVWSNLIRKRYFPNPVPDSFYSGNNVPKPNRGLLENYFAWEWGDALFVVLDPFANSLNGHSRDGWQWSLGLPQYQWLKLTLEQSHAKFKFVFLHNLLRGDQASRGGVEFAGFNEWGGKNTDGTDGFAQHRPGWDMPVHQLLLRNGVAAVFRAHDNFFAKQELDGIVYQMIPQPSFSGDDRIRDLQNYGYKKGTFLGNSGDVRVTVSPNQCTVDYVRCVVPGDEDETHQNRKVAFSYTIPSTPTRG